jgi:hypothetical protein
MSHIRTLVSASNPVYGDAANTTVRMNATFAELPNSPGIDFLAVPNDVEVHGKEILARALAGEFGTVGPYVAPVAPAAKPATPTTAQTIADLTARLAALEAAKK